jgi:pilus assembly protein CpaF
LNNEDVKTESDSEDFYKKIRSYVFESISPTEILRSKTENPDKIKDTLRNLSIRAIQESKRIVPVIYQENIINRLINEVFGFGIIQPLLDNKDISEIMINSPDEVYIEKNGKLERADVTFDNANQILHIIDRIVSPLGRRIDESSPIVDARLPDGSRINAVIPPIAVKSPTLTIRKFKETILDYDSIVRLGALTQDMVTLIDSLVKARINILISGGTGSGKTTLLNVCSTSIPKSERIVTIEDSVELKLHQPHVVSLEGRPSNIEGKGQVTIRELVINSLRMRPDRIIVGEVRGSEAFDMLQAMNTGHDGSLSTIHANAPKDVISRLTSMIYMAGVEMPISVLREMIFSAIELIIQTARLPDGSRKVISISELSSFEDGEIILNDVYNYVQDRNENSKIIGHYEYQGIGERMKKKLKNSLRSEDAEQQITEEDNINKNHKVDDKEKKVKQVKINSLLKILEEKKVSD